MIALELNDDGFVGYQLREAAREHGYGEDVERFLREVLCRALYYIGALSSSACAQVTGVERVEWLVKHGISAKSVAEQAHEAVDDMLGLLGETRPEEEMSRDPD
jgi:hypothetical protein